MGNSWGLALAYVVTCPAVDGFVAISGWYGIRFAWGKVLRLWGVVMFYSVVLFLGEWMLALSEPGGGLPRFSVGSWWFATSYLALMFVTPLLNAGLEWLAQTPRRLLMAWGLYASAVTLDWLSIYLPLGMTATGWGSHTINTLVFVYVTARTVRLLHGEAWLRRWGGWCALCLLLALMATVPLRVILCQLVGRPSGGIWPGALTYYNVPFVWGAAVLALGAFLVLRPSAWVGRVLAFVGPSLFGVYLIRYNPIGLEFLVRRPEAWLLARFPALPDCLTVLFCAIGCFFSCIVIDLVRRVLLALISGAFRQFRVSAARI